MSYELEEEFLIAVSHLHPELDSVKKSKITGLCREPLNWGYLIRRAVEEGVDSLLYYNLKKITQGLNPPCPPFIKGSAGELLSAQYYSNLISNIHLLDEFYEVLKRLHQMGIQVILLKGVFLIEGIYKNIGLRPMSDVDILVRKESLPPIMREMEEMGYHITPHGHLGYLKDGAFPSVIDFHWDIWFPETDDLWKRCVGIMMRDISVYTLDYEDMLMYMCAHQSIHHGMHRLIWLCDIHEFIHAFADRIHWDIFVKRVRDYHIGIPLYYTLSYTQRLFKTEIPSSVLEAFKPLKPNSLKAEIFKKTTVNHYTVDVGHMLYLLLLKGFRNRFVYLMHYIFPERDFIVKRYSVSKGYIGYFYFLIRPLVLLFKGARAVYQIIF